MAPCFRYCPLVEEEKPALGSLRAGGRRSERLSEYSFRPYFGPPAATETGGYPASLAA
jgi:hypothetical protein